MKGLSEIRMVNWIKILIYGLLLLGIYYSTLSRLVIKDWHRDAYSYGPLIPFIVLYLIWIKRHYLISMPSVPTWKGLAPLFLGFLFYWIGELGGEYLTLYFSFWLVMIGLLWLHFGWQKLKSIAFALLFMLTMFPLPSFINTRLMLKLRLISSELGVAIIDVFGLPVYREGNIIDLGFTQLQVVEACSGLNSLISLVVLCLLLVYFFEDYWWKRAVLLVSSVPLAIFSNSMRIALTAILYKFFGEAVAQGFFHGFSGLLIFVFCIPVLIIEMKILEKLPPVKKGSSKVGSDENPSEMRLGVFSKFNPSTIFRRYPRGIGSTPVKYGSHFTGQAFHRAGGVGPSAIFRSYGAGKGYGLFKQPVFVASVILLGATLVLSSTVEFREKIPVKMSLNQFPLKVGEWSADKPIPLAQIFINALDLSEYVMVDYRDRSGKSVNFYVAYYETQSKGKSIHSPATCLPGSGWDFRQSGTVRISDVLLKNGAMRVNRALMQQGRQYQISYYWFPGRGRILTNAYQLKLYGFWDSVTKQRTDGALVRLVTQVYADEKIEGAEERLQKFVRDIVPVLEKFIPGKEI